MTQIAMSGLMESSALWLSWAFARRNAYLWFTTGVTTIAISARLALGAHFIDDAYISFRYARNLAGGLGFTYNAGERVLGTSTPLWTLILAAGSRAGSSVETSALILGIAFDAAALILLFRISRVFFPGSASVVPALLYAVAPFSIFSSVSGMETSLYLFLLLLCFDCVLEERYASAALAAALASLTRPEGILAYAAVIGTIVMLRRRGLPRAIASGAIILLPWVLFASLYFGSPIPNSVIAKLAVFPAEPEPWKSLREMAQRISEPFSGFPITPILYIPIALAGAFVAMRRKPAAIVIILWFLLFVTFFALPNRYLFPWYSTPLIPFALLFVTLAVWNLGRRAAKLVESGPFIRFFPKLGWTATAFALVVSTLGTLQYLAGLNLELAHREQVYHEIGAELRKDPAVKLVASAEIGALGYAFDGEILDLSGLVSPAVLPYYHGRAWKTDGPFPVADKLILDSRPGTIVAFDRMIPFLNDPWFLATYEPRKQLIGLHPFYGSLIIFSRIDATQGPRPAEDIAQPTLP